MEKWKLANRKLHSSNSTVSCQLYPSSSPWWLHCVPVMWNGISTGSLQESGLLHWEHWNWCCHELDHEPHGRSWWVASGNFPGNIPKLALHPVCVHVSVPCLSADFSAPLVLPGSSSGPGTTPTESLSEEHLATIVSMGFSRDQATKALRATVRMNVSIYKKKKGRLPHVFIWKM